VRRKKRKRKRQGETHSAIESGRNEGNERQRDRGLMQVGIVESGCRKKERQGDRVMER